MEYYKLGKEHAPLHPKTRSTLELLLLILDKYGEKEMVLFIKKKILHNQEMWDNQNKWPILVKKYLKQYGVHL